MSTAVQWYTGAQINLGDLTPRLTYALIKKKSKFSIYKKIQCAAVAKSYMKKGFLIYEDMRKYFLIYEEAGSHI
jgi:hypothetical protein